MSNKKTKLVIFFLLFIVSLVIISGYKIDNFLSNNYFGVKTDDTLINIDKVTDSSNFNVLLIGTDKSSVRTDAIMLVNVNKQNKTISMLSIPRDTKVTVNDKTCKINVCFAKGGVDLLAENVKKLTGAPINYYAVIKPGMLGDIVDCLGGVEYTVEKDMKYTDESQDLYINLKKGKQILNGDQAEQYCRYRSYVMGDLERTRAQQKFFKALFEQKLKLKYVTKIKSVYDAMSNNLESNVTLKDSMYQIDLMFGCQKSI